MMNVLILSLLAVVSTVGAAPAFDQKPAGNPTRINACTILTPDVVAKFTTATKMKATSAPTDAPIGVKGSQCDYSGIALHIDPFATVTADRMRKSPDKDWAQISGVGETAYFQNVKDAFAEVFVWTGSTLNVDRVRRS